MRVCPKNAGLFSRKLRDATVEVKLMVYTMFVQPTLEYGSIIWDYQRYQINKLE